MIEVEGNIYDVVMELRQQNTALEKQLEVFREMHERACRDVQQYSKALEIACSFGSCGGCPCRSTCNSVPTINGINCWDVLLEQAESELGKEGKDESNRHTS